MDSISPGSRVTRNRLSHAAHGAHRAAQKQITVDTATATPNGTFKSAGLSNEILGFARNPNEKKPLTSTPTLRSVSPARCVRNMETTAIKPETKMLPSSTNKHIRAPRQ